MSSDQNAGGFLASGVVQQTQGTLIPSKGNNNPTGAGEYAASAAIAVDAGGRRRREREHYCLNSGGVTGT